jgi:hypothetical protein
MFISGHLASSYLVFRLGRVGLKWVVAASLFPDLVDKGLRFAGVFATGRHLGHSFIALSLSTVIIAVWRGKYDGLAWFVGYAAHLLADLPFSWAMPWFYSLKFGAWHHSAETGLLNLATGQVVLDLIVTVTALVVFFSKKRVADRV